METEREKIVLDTSVWIAAVIAPQGAAAATINKSLENYTPVGSPETMEELRRKLIDNPKLDEKVPLQKREETFQEAKAVTTNIEVTTKLQICRDPKDDMFVNLALASGAKQIVTLDKDLSDLKQVQGIQIYTAAEFLQREKQLDERRSSFRAVDIREASPKSPNEQRVFTACLNAALSEKGIAFAIVTKQEAAQSLQQGPRFREGEIVAVTETALGYRREGQLIAPDRVHKIDQASAERVIGALGSRNSLQGIQATNIMLDQQAPDE